MKEYMAKQEERSSRNFDGRKSGCKQLKKIIDNRFSSPKQVRTFECGLNPVQFVRKEMYSGEKLRKFLVVERMLLEEARGGYSRKNVTDILEGASPENMEKILSWSDVHIKTMFWDRNALDILKHPDRFPARYGKGKVKGKIAEEEWSETSLDKTLKTTYFTSCLGVACKCAHKIKVLHLVMVGGGQDKCVTDVENKSDAMALIRQVTSGAEEKAIFGCLDCWCGGKYGNQVIPNYRKELGLGGYKSIGKGEGIWEVAWDRTRGLIAKNSSE